MSIATPIQHEQSIVLNDVTWHVYEGLLKLFGDRRLRHSYDRGVLEIMSPSRKHEYDKKLLGKLLDHLANEMDIDIMSMGSSTQRKRKAQKGLEPDECYYFGKEPLVRFLDLDEDDERWPPLDLAVEVDVTSSSIDRMTIYASLKVVEVWRYDGTDMVFYRLNKSGRYVVIEHSLTFPFLTSEQLSEFLAQRQEKSERELIRTFVRWVRRQLRDRKA